MKTTTRLAFPLICLGLTACVGAPETGGDDAEPTLDLAPIAEGHPMMPVGANDTASEQPTVPAVENGVGYSSTTLASTSSGIDYHGGAVMANGVNVYFIWYGNWSGSSAPTILTDLVSHIGGTPWFNINTTYGDATGFVKNSVNYAGFTVDGYSQGLVLTGTGVASVVSRALNTGALPVDANGVYFVLTSSDVFEQGFCTDHCGWHTHGTLSGTDIKYSFVGNPDLYCPSACEAQILSPNGNPGADAMASVIAHELAESVTDPDLDAWSDEKGYENADKCAWTFGSTYMTPTAAQANMKIGSRDYLIQRNWVNVGSGYCDVGYTTSSILPGFNQSLTTGQRLTSADGRFTLVMQGDGNLVLYWNGHGALWATGTNGTNASRATMQTDGNFVLYDAANTPIWASNTSGHPGAFLTVQNDGNVVMYAGPTAIWASNTCCH